MRFVNYYFYRMYMIYLNRKEYARITTCIFFCKLFLLALFFISVYTIYYMTGGFFVQKIPSIAIYLTAFIAPVVFGIIIYNYYSKNRIKKIQELYGKSKYNELISDKLIQSVPYIELTIGFIIWFIIANS